MNTRKSFQQFSAPMNATLIGHEIVVKRVLIDFIADEINRSPANERKNLKGSRP